MDVVQWMVNQINKPVKAFLYAFNIDKWSCRHCQGSGVCRAGYNDSLGEKFSCSSCLTAANENEEFSSIVSKRVKCAICNGTGKAVNT